MNAGSVRAVGASIASVTFDDCERAARAALAAPTSVAARVAAKEA